ncbi:MAG TPA: hypothetical protein VMT27_02680 [Actinomycetes bacterium]|nr:hypothetical protein [Actinomycetes bacterium]
MRYLRRGFITAFATAAALGAATLGVGSAGAATETWHVLTASQVESTRITLTMAQQIDSTISAIVYGKGGQANFEKCGLVRTERISVARNTRWTAPDREGITLIMQLSSVTDSQALFARARTAYLACTPATFGYKYPARVDVTGSWLTKKKELRLRWTIYSDATKTTTKKADGLTIRRQGAALIITRSESPSAATVNQGVNSLLTTKQAARYRAVALS